MKKILFLVFSMGIFLTSHSQNTLANYNTNRLLVVGGGGARGAWGAGYAKFLSNKFGPYKVAFGTSTGSLMIPLIILNDFESLKQGYTHVTQKSIFNINPFIMRTGELRGLHSFWRILTGKKTFGESKNLRRLINTFMTQEKFNTILASNGALEFVVTVADFKTGAVEYKSSSEIHDYKQMGDWIWASANEPLFMSYYEKGGHAYVDGGVMENVPLTHALEYAVSHSAITDIDVIINKPKYPISDTFENRKLIKGLGRLIDLFNLKVRDDGVLIPSLQNQIRDLKNQLADCQDRLSKCKKDNPTAPAERQIAIWLHYYPVDMFYGIYKKELVLDPTRMAGLWDIGIKGDQYKNFLSEKPIIVSEGVLKEFIYTLKQLKK